MRIIVVLHHIPKSDPEASANQGRSRTSFILLRWLHRLV